MKKSIEERSREKILVLDGAMGTMIQRYKLEEDDYRGERFASHPSPVKGNNDLLCLTRPDIIATIHDAYFEAGADIAETNTFNANRISMADYHVEDLVREINYEGARIAVESAKKYSTPDQPRYVAGSIGPTNRTASLSPDVNRPGFRNISFDQLSEAYQEQAEALIEGGVDVLLIETVFDTLNAKAALFAVEEAFHTTGKIIPVMVSGTITDASGRTLSGQTPEAFLFSLEHFPLLSIGFNCALGAAQLRPHLQSIAPLADCLTSAHPNAGLPNAFGEYDESPEQMAVQIKSFLDRDLLNIIGGCCGTTPEHIKAIANLASNYKPRTRVKQQTDKA